MTITLPDELRGTLERGAAKGGFRTVDEYVAELVPVDEEPFTPDFRTREELHKLLDEGTASGPPVPCDAAFWERLDAVIRNAEAKKRGAA